MINWQKQSELLIQHDATDIPFIQPDNPLVVQIRLAHLPTDKSGPGHHSCSRIDGDHVWTILVE